MNSQSSTPLPSLLLLAFSGLAFAGQTQACSLNISHPNRYATCLYNQAVDEGSKAGNQEYDRLVAIANTQAGDIKKTATNDARTIRDNADQRSRDIAAAAIKTVDQFRSRSLAIGQDEYNKLVSTYDKSLKASTAALTSLANTALTAKNIDAATAARLRTAGVNALNKESQKLLNLRASMNNLDGEGQLALHRVLRSIPSGKIDAQAMCDVPRLAKKLGMMVGLNGETTFSQNIPGALANSNFNLCLGGAGAYGVGGNAAVCFAMEVVPTDVPRRDQRDANGATRAYKMAVVQTVGGSAGIGAGVGPSVGWSPGAINTKITPFIGLEGGAGPIGASMAWDVALKDMGATPGFSLGTGVGTPLAGLIDAGVSIPVYDGYWTLPK